MFEIIVKPKFKKEINKTFLEEAYKVTLTLLNDLSNPNVSIFITDDREMKRYNLEYRGVNSSTDVLSFNNEYVDLETGESYLGDIIISFETAKCQAAEYKHTVGEELQFLVVHGLLHLFGYNHEKDQEKMIMWDLQKKILNALKIFIDNPSY